MQDHRLSSPISCYLNGFELKNRLDKTESSGLLTRRQDPSDRRGVLLEMTEEGRGRLDAYAELGARRERELLDVLEPTEKRQLNDLLRKLVTAMLSELGPPPKRRLQES
jgi:DNA-binding MarR family transcriptional regulator